MEGQDPVDAAADVAGPNCLNPLDRAHSALPARR